MKALKVLNWSFVALLPSFLSGTISSTQSLENQHVNKESNFSLDGSMLFSKKLFDASNAESIIARAYFDVVGVLPPKIQVSKLLKDFAGNQYFLAVFKERGYGVLNVANNDVVELAPFGRIPFDFGGSDEMLYVPWQGFYKTSQGKCVHLQTGRTVGSEESNQLKKESARYLSQALLDGEKPEYKSRKKSNELSLASANSKPVIFPETSGLIHADHEIPHSWFFKKNSESFPNNTNGFCGYVAASLLLAYSEIFECTGYFSPLQSSKYITPHVGEPIWENGELSWGGVPNLCDTFPKDIWGQGIGGSVPADIGRAIKYFLSGKPVSYDIYERLWRFGDEKTPIKNGHPVACFGHYTHPGNHESHFDHVAVAYGYYDNGNLLCHFGWNYASQVVMSPLGIFQTGGYVAIYNKTPHQHNEYFKDKRTGKHYCGCGRLMRC